MDECYHIGLQCFHLCVDIYLVKKMRALAACVYVELASVLQVVLFFVFCFFVFFCFVFFVLFVFFFLFSFSFSFFLFSSHFSFFF